MSTQPTAQNAEQPAAPAPSATQPQPRPRWVSLSSRRRFPAPYQLSWIGLVPPSMGR